MDLPHRPASGEALGYLDPKLGTIARAEIRHTRLRQAGRSVAEHRDRQPDAEIDSRDEIIMYAWILDPSSTPSSIEVANSQHLLFSCLFFYILQIRQHFEIVQKLG